MGEAIPGRRRAQLAVLLGSLSAISALTIDMYLPGMPHMAEDLGTSAGLAQLTITTFVIGLALGQLVIGPLSDRWGRRVPLLVGTGVYVAASVACALAPGVGWLIAARLLQALGAAAGTVLARAVVRDLFEGTTMTRMFSSLTLVMSLAPVIGPVLGAQILAVSTWRTVFLVLAVAGAVLLAATVALLPESLPAERRAGADTRGQVRQFGGLLRDVAFMRNVLASSLLLAAMFLYIAGSSFALQDVYGLSAQEFSLVFAANGLGIVLFAQLNAMAVGRVRESRLLTVALAAGAIAGAGVLLCTLADLPLGALLPCLFVVVAVVGPVGANSTSLALADHAAQAGAASSLLGLAQFLFGGVAAALLGLFDQSSALPMGAAIAVCAVAALAAQMLVRSRSSRRGCAAVGAPETP